MSSLRLLADEDCPAILRKLGERVPPVATLLSDIPKFRERGFYGIGLGMAVAAV